jgi:hypothetical protein
MAKIKILVISTSYAEKSTGKEAAGSFVNAFINDLNALNDIDVKIIYPSLSETPNNNVEKPFKVKFLPLSLLKIKNIFHWKHIYNTLSNGSQLVNTTSLSFKPDYILALWALPSGYWARKIAKKQNIPYCNWCLGSDIWNLSKIPIVKSILKRVLRDAKWNFADGYQLCKDVVLLSKKECLFLPSSRHLNHDDISPLEKKRKN